MQKHDEIIDLHTAKKFAEIRERFLVGFFVLFVCLFICFEFLLLGRQPIPCSLARAKSDKHPFAQLTLGGVAEPQESVLAKGVCCVHIEANVRKETTCQSWLPCVFPSFHRNYA